MLPLFFLLALLYVQRPTIPLAGAPLLREVVIPTDAKDLNRPNRFVMLSGAKHLNAITGSLTVSLLTADTNPPILHSLQAAAA